MWIQYLDPVRESSMCMVGQNHTFIGIYDVHTVFLAGKSPYIRSYTEQIYGSGQPYVCGYHVDTMVYTTCIPRGSSMWIQYVDPVCGYHVDTRVGGVFALTCKPNCSAKHYHHIVLIII
jgi:hypothetical protein